MTSFLSLIIGSFTEAAGLGMLVNHGVAGIRLRTGLEADPAVRHAELSRILALS
jgi:hypothetical protein